MQHHHRPVAAGVGIRETRGLRPLETPTPTPSPQHPDSGLGDSLPESPATQQCCSRYRVCASREGTPGVPESVGAHRGVEVVCLLVGHVPFLGRPDQQLADPLVSTMCLSSDDTRRLELAELHVHLRLLLLGVVVWLTEDLHDVRHGHPGE